MKTIEFLIGFGCFFSYLYLGKYIEYAKSYSTIYVTIEKSLPNVVRYLIGVAPIFLGYKISYWSYTNFFRLYDFWLLCFLEE